MSYLCRSNESQHHLGITLAGMLTLTAVAATLTVAAVVVTPRFSNAQSVDSGLIAAKHETNNQFIHGLAELIGRSVEVLAIHDRDNSPYLEMVIWLEDHQVPGKPSIDEVAVISHSQILGTIVLYRMGLDENSSIPVVLKRADLKSVNFCNQWRANPRSVPTVLATGISDMRVERTGSPYNGAQRLRITLTWAEDSSDGSDKASVLVDAAMFHSEARE
ncbi:MAG: hypothetical protein IH984_03085 [Planctomycetes bacterium]|nr:hypothetical protein [Planctomycetota bacterium]